MGFPRTPFLTVAEDLPLYRQSQACMAIGHAGFTYYVEYASKQTLSALILKFVAIQRNGIAILNAPFLKLLV